MHFPIQRTMTVAGLWRLRRRVQESTICMHTYTWPQTQMLNTHVHTCFWFAHAYDIVPTPSTRHVVKLSSADQLLRCASCESLAQPFVRGFSRVLKLIRAPGIWQGRAEHLIAKTTDIIRIDVMYTVGRLKSCIIHAHIQTYRLVRLLQSHYYIII